MEMFGSLLDFLGAITGIYLDTNNQYTQFLAYGFAFIIVFEIIHVLFGGVYSFISKK